jgi:5-methyltetrahydropteroyltriglutamate--homocysteine methyltransferase
MIANKPPFRAEHIGSLPRPERLMAAREQHVAGRIPKAELTRIEDECVLEAVKMQERSGIEVVTDGEYRKRGWREFLYDKVQGFGPDTVERDFPIRLNDGRLAPTVLEPKVTARLARREPLTADDFSAVKKMTSKPVKATLPTPSVAHFFPGDAVLTRSVHADREGLMDDVARILREEIADLAARGCTYVQLDEVPLAVMCDPANMDVVRRRGEDPGVLIESYLNAINNSLRDRPANMAVGVHLCRGNYAQGMADGGYEPIAERLFNKLNVDGFFLEFDTPRAGDFAPLRHLPKSRKAILGLVSTKVADLESKDALKRRIDEASKYVDLDRLGVSPQCGFASIPVRAGLGFPMDITERKLGLIVELARDVWG